MTRETTLPPAARALSTFGRIDYHDAFLVQTGRDYDRTAGQWARVMLEDAPETTQHTLRKGWSTLGLQLGPARSDDCVLGWEIRNITPDVALLGVSGRRGLSGELLFERQPGTPLFATFVHLDNRVARTLWAGIAPRHRRGVSRSRAATRSVCRWLISPEIVISGEPGKGALRASVSVRPAHLACTVSRA